MEHLPALGIGISLSLAADPDPVALLQTAGGPSFIEYAGLADVSRVADDVARIRNTGATVLYHPSFINFCGSFPNHQEWLAATARHIAATGSPWFAQDCAYCFWQNDPGYSSQLGYFIPPILNETSLSLAVARIREVQAMVPVTVAIEPPPMTFAVGTMPLFTFFGQLAQQADCALLLDMGHLVSWEAATGQRVLDHLADLPCERVIEAHIAGGKIKNTPGGDVYIDAHEAGILDASWAMLENLLPALPSLKALCYECEGVGTKTVIATLEKLCRLVHNKSSSPALLAATRAAA